VPFLSRHKHEAVIHVLHRPHDEEELDVERLPSAQWELSYLATALSFTGSCPTLYLSATIVLVRHFVSIGSGTIDASRGNAARFEPSHSYSLSRRLSHVCTYEMGATYTLEFV